MLLLLPGFLALQVFNATSHKRRLSDLESVFWVLLFAFILLAPCAIVWHRLDGSVPSLGTLIREPQSVPIRLAATLYMVAVPFGWLVGQLDRSVGLERSMLRLGIDLKRRQDVWFLAFRDSYYVIVYLKGGDLIYGWPLMSTTDRSGGAAELFLEATRVWDRDARDWREQPGVTGMWIDASSIERIEFTREPLSADDVH